MNQILITKNDLFDSSGGFSKFTLNPSQLLSIFCYRRVYNERMRSAADECRCLPRKKKKKDEWKILFRDKVGRQRRGAMSGNLNPGDTILGKSTHSASLSLHGSEREQCSLTSSTQYPLYVSESLVWLSRFSGDGAQQRTSCAEFPRGLPRGGCDYRCLQMDVLKEQLHPKKHNSVTHCV